MRALPFIFFGVGSLVALAMFTISAVNIWRSEQNMKQIRLNRHAIHCYRMAKLSAGTADFDRWAAEGDRTRDEARQLKTYGAWPSWGEDR